MLDRNAIAFELLTPSVDWVGHDNAASFAFEMADKFIEASKKPERSYDLPVIQLFWKDEIWEIDSLGKDQNLILKKLSDGSYSELLPLSEFFDSCSKAFRGRRHAD